MGPIESYGAGIPGLDTSELTGKLIVLEGTDGVGRSTLISLLKVWLETAGRAVVDMETSQSALTGTGLKKAKQGHTLGPMTMSLFYATDLADNIEHLVIPAMRAGFVVMTDRYIYSLIARAMMRGMDKEWMRKTYSFALKPDAVFYLKASVSDIIPRVLHSTGFDYWESGMDMKLGDTYYDSFCDYQKKLIQMLDAMASEYKFKVVDASRSIEEVLEEIKDSLADILKLKTRKRHAEEKGKAAEKGKVEGKG